MRRSDVERTGGAWTVADECLLSSAAAKSARHSAVINRCQRWLMEQNDRLFTALVVLAGIGTTALIAVTIFSF